MTSFIILLISFLFVAISLIGYGYIFIRIFFKKATNEDFGYLGIFGVIFSIFISYLTNLVTSHNYVFNSLYLITGLISFIFVIRKYEKKNLIQNLKQFFILFFIIFVSLLMFKNHDDFSYYHFVSTYILTQYDLTIGIGQFNHGFRTPSSIFYLNSLFFLPLIKFYSFNFGAVLILLFTNLIFINKLNFMDFLNKNYLLKNKKNIQLNFVFFFSLFSLIFINIFFYRISEHGTDRSAQILVMLLFAELLIYFNQQISNKSEIEVKIFTLLILIISLKAFYIIYMTFFILIFWYNLKFSTFFEIIKKFTFKKYIIFFLLTFSLIISSYFFSTGCLIYPLKISCFENFTWSIPITQVDQMNQWYQQWSKAGAGPNFRVESPEIYIQKFNWLSNWFEVYFFNKVSDFLIGLIFVSFLVVWVFYKYSIKKVKFRINNFIFKFYFLIIILFFEWFYNHPSLRYGGYSIIAALFFVPISIKLSTYQFRYNKFKNVLIIFIILNYSIFLIRNIDRINNESDLYGYKFNKNSFYEVSDEAFIEYNNINNQINEFNKCEIKPNCSTEKLGVDKKLGKYIFKN